MTCAASEKLGWGQAGELSWRAELVVPGISPAPRARSWDEAKLGSWKFRKFIESGARSAPDVFHLF